MPSADTKVPTLGADDSTHGNDMPDALWGHLYPELKALARSRLRRSGNFTLLDTTALVNQSCLKMLERGTGALEGRQRLQFLAYASAVMRSVVIDLARERLTDRRGNGGLLRLDLLAIGPDTTVEDDPLIVDMALTDLRIREPRLAQVVEMRFFGGFPEIEIAEALGISERSVRRDWEKARLLMRMLLA
ncbi:MAG: hypothetical protein C0434_11620 [Xanthomonadaceae bacterium]|nr:hypothetical protein [Xanthomonadaceae bacterium]